MKKTDAIQEIAERHRKAIQAVMKKYNLKVDPWCKKAGVTEGALRNFLKGESNSMGANTLELLAKAAGLTVGDLLGGAVHYRVDETLMSKSTKAIENAALSEGRNLKSWEISAYAVRLYNHIIEFRSRGKNIDPSEENASLILKSAICG